VAIVIVALVAICAISYGITGSVVPKEAKDILIFQNALLLLVLGSAVLEHKFTKPADSMVNGLMGTVTLMTVYGKAPTVGWWAVFAYCLVVFLVAGTCTAVSSRKVLTGWQERVARTTYRPAVVLGKGRLLYSVVFLFAVASFYSMRSVEAGISGYHVSSARRLIPSCRQ